MRHIKFVYNAPRESSSQDLMRRTVSLTSAQPLHAQKCNARDCDVRGTCDGRQKVQAWPGSSITRLAPSTTVQGVVSTIRRKFADEVEDGGRTVKRPSCVFPDGPQFIIRMDDDQDTWEEVVAKLLQLKAKGRLSAFPGVIELRALPQARTRG